MPTIDAGDIALVAEEETAYGFKLSGCNILNNPGSLLTRKKYDLKGNNYLNHHIKKFVSKIVGKYTPYYISKQFYFLLYIGKLPITIVQFLDIYHHS